MSPALISIHRGSQFASHAKLSVTGLPKTSASASPDDAIITNGRLPEVERTCNPKQYRIDPWRALDEGGQHLMTISNCPAPPVTTDGLLQAPVLFPHNRWINAYCNAILREAYSMFGPNLEVTYTPFEYEPYRNDLGQLLYDRLGCVIRTPLRLPAHTEGPCAWAAMLFQRGTHANGSVTDTLIRKSCEPAEGMVQALQSLLRTLMEEKTRRLTF